MGDRPMIKVKLIKPKESCEETVWTLGISDGREGVVTKLDDKRHVSAVQPYSFEQG